MTCLGSRAQLESHSGEDKPSPTKRRPLADAISASDLLAVLDLELDDLLLELGKASPEILVAGR